MANQRHWSVERHSLEVFLNDMRYINPRFTYLLTYTTAAVTTLAAASHAHSVICCRCAVMTCVSNVIVITGTASYIYIVPVAK